MVVSNVIRKVIGKFIYTIFDPIIGLYYKYGSSCPPKSYYHRKWLEDPEIYEWDYLNYPTYDPICFPLVFKINCIGCHGCEDNPNPFLGVDKPKGSWKVVTTEIFNKQYEDLFGKEDLVDLLYNLEKHNEEVDKNETKEDM